MKIDRDTAFDIYGGDHPDYKEVGREHEESSRWSQYWNVYFERTDGKFFALGVDLPSTEMQDGQDIFQDEKVIELYEVKKVQKTIDAWEVVESEEEQQAG